MSGQPTGLAAYDAWANDLQDASNFPEDEVVLRERLKAHEVTILELAERRWYGALFLRGMRQTVPEIEEELISAASCWDAIHDIVWAKLLPLTGEHAGKNSPAKIADADVRQEMAGLILQAKARDEEAARHLEGAFNKLG